ncbi:hypothetical protein [Streptomyces atroolivaceus]|uniref:Uncharacterized protein n=1 Tax=Streptomyces atroolivaceus TaxID=66869 RepID=A0ABV9VJ29_STRAZ|nr:hypothetical protein [Streptomyces atroolivaceus]
MEPVNEHAGQAHAFDRGSAIGRLDPAELDPPLGTLSVPALDLALLS